MTRPPPRSTRTDPLFPCTSLFRSLTSEFKMNFLAPADGERFVATGRVVKPGRRLSVCQVEVQAHRGGQSVLCLVGLMTAVRVTRSEEHTSELQSLMRISYAVFFLTHTTTRRELRVTSLTPTH